MTSRVSASALGSLASRIIRADVLESSSHAGALGPLLGARGLAGGASGAVPLHAVGRSESGSRAAAKLRARGLVPGVVHSFQGSSSGSDDDRVLLAFEKKAVSTLHQRIGSYGFACQVFDIHVVGDGDELPGAGPERDVSATYRVLGRQIHITASSAEPENVTFIELCPDRKVRVEVPLKTFGRETCPGIRAGGRVNWIRRTVPCLVDTAEVDGVPASFEVDISGLDVNDKVLWTELALPVGVEVLLKDRRQPVLKMARK
ncbi:MAG: hypothetical protein ABGY24_09910 [bacterium]